MTNEIRGFVVIKFAVKKIYHSMQRNYISFRILVWLKEHGITRRVNFMISHSDDREYRANPTESMKESKVFFAKNEDRLDKVKRLLADDRSRETLGGG